MRTKFKAWAEPFINEHPEYSLTDEEISKLDGFELEIGSGKGEFLVQMSKKFPDKFFLGVEKNVTCAGISMKKLVENEINNAKLVYRDGQEIVRLIKDNAVDTIFLNFSDPWPKKRHYKRRLTSISFLNEYKRILKDDGRLIFKTDNVDLFEYSLEMFKEANFNFIKVDNDYVGLDSFDSQTEYEQFFRNEGTPIHRLILSK